MKAGHALRSMTRHLRICSAQPAVWLNTAAPCPSPRRCQLLEWCDPATDAYPSTVLAGTCLLSYDPLEGRDAYIMLQVLALC